MYTNRSSITPDEALQRLVAGNRRFLRGEMRLPDLLQTTLTDLAQNQNPYATILGCSDSRVPPELVFDAGLGDLFVVRVAGNILSPRVAGSLQYAGALLNTPLFVVLGHEGCGAVIAALKTRDEGATQHSHIQFLVDSILPALPPFDPKLSMKERIDQAVESNVRWTVARILESSDRDASVIEDKMKVVGAIYEIETGRVKFLD
jgi:carbonic anhydrase